MPDIKQERIRLKKNARYCNKIGIKYLTVYAFSTENWKRPQKEVEAIIDLLRNYLRDAENYKKENIRVRFIGDISVFDQEIRMKIAESQSESKEFTGLNLNIAINYGGKDEIVHAAKLLAKEAAEGALRSDDIDETAFESRLYTAGQPNVDLVIRPSGEYRLSNFMVWQSAYAEFVFMNVLWPDFTEKHLNEALRNMPIAAGGLAGCKQKSACLGSCKKGQLMFVRLNR